MAVGVADRAGDVGPATVAAVTEIFDDVDFAWCGEPVTEGVPVVQVYGWLLYPDDGRVLVQDTGDGFNLPGGRPEPEDADMLATLRREALEESQVTVTDAAYLGYERVFRDGQRRALVRMVGRIGEFLPRHPDPDGGRLLGRLLTPLEQAPLLLGWGASGLAQVRTAARVAEDTWGLSTVTPSSKPSFVD